MAATFLGTRRTLDSQRRRTLDSQRLPKAIHAGFGFRVLGFCAEVNPYAPAYDPGEGSTRRVQLTLLVGAALLCCLACGDARLAGMP